MHKICKCAKKICIGPRSISPVHLYAFICKICKHESHLQNMQKYAPLTFLMSKACTEHALKILIWPSRSLFGFVTLENMVGCATVNN